MIDLDQRLEDLTTQATAARRRGRAPGRGRGGRRPGPPRRLARAGADPTGPGRAATRAGQPVPRLVAGQHRRQHLPAAGRQRGRPQGARPPPGHAAGSRPGLVRDPGAGPRPLPDDVLGPPGHDPQPPPRGSPRGLPGAAPRPGRLRPPPPPPVRRGPARGQAAQADHRPGHGPAVRAVPDAAGPAGSTPRSSSTPGPARPMWPPSGACWRRPQG